MKLSDEERTVIVAMQFEKAAAFISQAKANADLDFWDVVANRLYYAVFHAAAGVFIHDELKVETHKGAVVMFGKNYVSTGKFTKDEAKLFSNLQSLREKSDYNCVYQSDAEEMRPLIEGAERLIEKMKSYSM